jgi:transposase InsO family protein
VLAWIGELMDKYHISLRELTRLIGLAYASVRRWRDRARRGLPALLKPGPHKLEPLDLERFGRAVGELVHRRRRSLGSGALHEGFGESLSRRDIDAAVRQARSSFWIDKKAHCFRVVWKHPNLAWAMDDTRFAGRSGNIHTVRDLASRYTFAPMTGPLPNGEQVAANLEHLVLEHGAPLFLKRDNGSNLNDEAVNEVLARHGIIPLNSPVRCPAYNGAIENAQKDWDRLLDASDPAVIANLQLYAQLAACRLNQMPRPVLGRQAPCSVFNGPDRIRFSKRQRHAAHAYITQKALDLIQSEGHDPARAWRTAVLIWLQMNNLIRIEPRNVSPCFPSKCAH